MKISNNEETKAKKQLIKILIVLAILWLLSSVVVYVKSLFAEEIKLTDVELMNKYYAEENIKSEMNFLAMKHYMDNITVEEYIETFFKGELNA